MCAEAKFPKNLTFLYCLSGDVCVHDFPRIGKRRQEKGEEKKESNGWKIKVKTLY